ncbi:hypothetical protein GCM10027176_64290 [Actinoallomurus bryophytorum]|uniref:Peptide/nickel transport system substrate-binding protein n=1 Tax=Actinoallomurus bryophytorum TaxID=1490222 RepID=A0A543CVC4_9ACTN|nr:ABC transporter substrate-binding protein [Actinoallomurus bryophytorum]TQM01047.1 peptide/nickel transport system substrate-binding protein [Actinoallomurus bryophytorum]
MQGPRPLRPGDPERLGDYRLTGLLGEGGQGIVYLGERLDDPAPDDPAPDGTAAEDDEPGPGKSRELFAIKLLRTHLSGDERARRYFARELAAAQRIDPFFTARIIEADVEGRTPYIVSEYVEGRPLSETVRGEGPMSGLELHRLAVGTLSALISIHQANVVHRDFKPSNVLLGAERPRVIDFGIARALDSTMSVTSGVVGTPAYMAPEQLNGQQVTPAVDVFAWGATMVFAATGAPPFGQDSIPVMMHRILNADPVIGNIQSPLRELVWYCLYKNPAHRPTTHQVMAGLGPAPVTPAPASSQQASSQQASPSQIPSLWGTGPQGGTPWGETPSPVNLQLPPDAPPPSPPPGDAGPDGTGSGPAQRAPGSVRRRWLPAVAAAAGVALVAAATVVVVNLDRPNRKPRKPSVAAAADAGLAKVVNPSTTRGGTLKLRQPADFDSLDPGDMYYTSSWNFSRLYARSLLTYRGAPGVAGLRPVPDLATGPGEASADLKTWTYRLRDGVTFEDGAPVTAKDVRYAVARTFAADVFATGPAYFRELLDAGTYAGPYKDADLDHFTGVTTPDDHTVVFHLKKPLADFDYLVAMPQTAPVPAAKDTREAYKEHPVSTGPYKIEQYTATKSVSLVRNPSWHSDGIRTALPDRIEVTFGQTSDAVDQQLVSGQADVDPDSTGLQAAAQARVLADPNLRKNTDTLTTGFLRYVALSTKVAPFDNVHCRRAVQYAVDRTATQTAGGGTQAAEPATNIAPPVIVGRERFDAYPADTAKAKQELASCGKPAGFSTRIAIREDRPKDKALAAAVQQALARVGISVRTEEYPTTDFYKDDAGNPEFVHKNGLGMILSAWGPDYPTAMGFFPQLVDGRQIQATYNNNLSELNDSGVNDVLDRLADTRDRTTREGLTADLDRKVMGTAAIVPLLYDKFVLYRGPRLTNASVSQMYVGYDLTTLGIG